MINKDKITEFFDNCASWWDSDMIRNEAIICKILDHADIRAGVHVLDVACGTGVLFPDYKRREVGSITAIDISPEMVKIAKQKHPDTTVICGDVEDTPFDRQFDRIMVYNAFPHFPDPAALIKRLAELLAPGGRLSVAHSMSREALDKHHERAAEVSLGLMHEAELADLFSQWLDVDVIISDDQMYQVSGRKRLANNSLAG